MERGVQPTLEKSHGFWTFDDLQALDTADWRRYEVLDGALVVTPAARPRHEAIAMRLAKSVGDQPGPGREMIGPVAIDLTPSYLIPDLVVMTSAAIRANEPLVPPSAVSVVVEVVSPSSKTMDRLVKPTKYAAAGIPAYWRVETDPVSLTAYALRDGAYAEVGTWHAGEIAELEAPVPVTIAMDALIP